MTPPERLLSAATVVEAIQRLSRTGIGRARASLAGYLILKSKEQAPGTEIEVRSSGPASAEPEVDRFLLVAPDTPKPHLNPFGTRQGRPEWLAPDYARSGVYGWLYPNRALARYVDVRQDGNRFFVKLPATAPEEISKNLGSKIQKVPLEPAAAFLLRRERFSPNATSAELRQRFQDVFHLSNQECNDLFETDPTFAVQFDDVGFTEGLASLPSDLHPPSPKSGQAAAARAAGSQVGLAPSEPDALIFPDAVLRRARRALARGRAITLVGPPGTGKSSLVDMLVGEAIDNPALFGLARSPQFDRYTAEAEWTARNIIGGFFPREDGRLVFREGYLLSSPRNDRWLVLDEMNRADLDRVLGPVLTFLAGQRVDLGQSELSDDGVPMLLAWGDEPESGVSDDETSDGTDTQRIYVAGRDWRLIGTYNSVDLGRVFSMGAALNRRWATVPVPPLPADRLLEVLHQAAPGLPGALGTVIQQMYAVHLDALPLGPAPFVDMARYAVDDDSPSPMAEPTDDPLDLLRDAYVMYIGPQLRRLSGESRTSFFAEVGRFLGASLADELASTF